MIALLILLNISIAIAFIAYSYKAATKLKGAGTLLQDGDTEGAGDMLYRAGRIYRQIIIASITLTIVVVLVSLASGTRTEKHYEGDGDETMIRSNDMSADY